MDDTELAAVWDFLNECTIAKSAGFMKSAYEVSAAALKRDSASPSNSSASDKTNMENTSDDDMQATPRTIVNVKRPKQRGIPKTQRERQKGYDQKHRMKRTNMRTEAAKTLVAGLKLLNLLLEDRILRTRKVSATIRLLHLGKDEQKFPDYDRDRLKINHEAKTNLGLNQAATTYIKLWTATWKLSKIEKGKYFLKSYAADIDGYLDELATHGEKLVEATTELESCVTQKPRGVWV
ncbi:hypothetical protein V7S43_017862 [Phytophthora oleae]|uniref:BZIP domain-containing protein n=1 Tax=Phytophthora oleae TaxID=2107226 RepID=A0ABD3EU44_9STRA